MIANEFAEQLLTIAKAGVAGALQKACTELRAQVSELGNALSALERKIEDERARHRGELHIRDTRIAELRLDVITLRAQMRAAGITPAREPRL